MTIRVGQLAAVAVVVAAALAGCSKHKAPPVERLELVSRFFDSVRKGDFETAARQGRKLYDMDRDHNEFMLHLITIHESNVFLRRAQKELNSGNVDAALRILDEGSSKYPENRTLRSYRIRIAQLKNAKALIADMRKAKGEVAMSASLTAARSGLDANRSPELEAFFNRYEAQIKKAQAAERKQRLIEAEKERKRLAQEKKETVFPVEPMAKLPPSRSGKNGTSHGGAKNVDDDPGDRPPPIASPESENKE